MNYISVIGASLFALATISGLAQAQEYLNIKLKEPQPVFICQRAAPLIHIMQGVLAVDGTLSDRRATWQKPGADGKPMCTYLSIQNEQVWVGDTLINVQRVQEEKQFFNGELLSFGIYKMLLDGGEIFFVLGFKVIDGQYLEPVDPITKTFGGPPPKS